MSLTLSRTASTWPAYPSQASPISLQWRPSCSMSMRRSAITVRTLLISGECWSSIADTALSRYGESWASRSVWTCRQVDAAERRDPASAPGEVHPSR